MRLYLRVREPVSVAGESISGEELRILSANVPSEMSKAFLRESDMPDLPDRAPPALLPAGAKNYLTPEGAERLRSELTNLIENERPPRVARGMDPDAKREIHDLDQRIRYLEQSLRTAEIVPRPTEETDEVRFGATVAVREPSGETARYRIVGVDEIDPEQGHISWLSPLARALTGARAGDDVTLKSPRGERRVHVVSVTYD